VEIDCFLENEDNSYNNLTVWMIKTLQTMASYILALFAF